MSENDGSPTWRTDLAALEVALGYAFRDRTQLESALMHSSYTNEQAAADPSARAPEPVEESNERLEFLGDAVIGLVVARRLYEAHPDWHEGDLTRALHDLVDATSLARVASKLGLGAWMRLGRTELRSGGHGKKSILADAMEAVIGAVYLDGGIEPVGDLARRLFGDALSSDAPRVERDPKTRLQEEVMALRGEFPTYRGVGDTGIEGDDQRFRVAVLVQGESWGEGTARSKREAERCAAVAGLSRLEAEMATAPSSEASDDGADASRAATAADVLDADASSSAGRDAVVQGENHATDRSEGSA